VAFKAHSRILISSWLSRREKNLGDLFETQYFLVPMSFGATRQRHGFYFPPSLASGVRFEIEKR